MRLRGTAMYSMPADSLATNRLEDVETAVDARSEAQLGSLDPRRALSQTETTLLAFLARGFTMKQIGDQMNLNPTTVQKYVGDLRRKMDARNNTQLVAYALSSKKKRKEIREDSSTLRHPLTASERAVIELLVLGWTAREIGEHLSLNHRTVERHIETLRLKMNARNVAHLVGIAFARGILKVARGSVRLSG